MESVFSDTTCIWENIQKFLASDNVSRDSKMTCGRTIDTYLTKMGTDIEALKHQYIRSGPERRPLEELAHDLEEKDKLIAAFTERLDKWKAKVDEYKAATMKALIGEETL